MLYRLDKKEYNVLLISVHVSPILSQLYDIFLNFGLFLGFFILEKLSWKEKTGGKNAFTQWFRGTT